MREIGHAVKKRIVLDQVIDATPATSRLLDGGRVTQGIYDNSKWQTEDAKHLTQVKVQPCPARLSSVCDKDKVH